MAIRYITRFDEERVCKKWEDLFYKASSYKGYTRLDNVHQMKDFGAPNNIYRKLLQCIDIKKIIMLNTNYKYQMAQVRALHKLNNDLDIFSSNK